MGDLKIPELAMRSSSRSTRSVCCQEVVVFSLVLCQVWFGFGIREKSSNISRRR